MRQSKMNIFGNYIRFVIVAVLPIILLAAPGVRATADIPYQQILGAPIDIKCYSSGQTELYFQDVMEYEDFYPGCSWGSILMLGNGETTMKYADPYHAICSGGQLRTFTPWSNTKPNDWEIDTVLKAYEAHVFVTQKIEYTNGNNYYKMTWTITNGSNTTYTDCTFIHGGNATFGGSDDSASYWNDVLGMIYLKYPEAGGLMGFYGGPDSAADRYFGGCFVQGMLEAFSGELSNTADPSVETDAGYYLQWNRASLAPGESWTIVAYEKWTGDGRVQVIAPAEESATNGDTVDLPFVVHNFQGTEDTFNLEADSELGWPVSLPGGSSVTIGAGQEVTVIVRVEVPAGTEESEDAITLTATSQADPEVTNYDSVNVTGTPAKGEEDDGDDVITPEDTGDSRHHNNYCFVSTAGASSNAGIFVLGAILISIGCALRRRTAEARIDR